MDERTAIGYEALGRQPLIGRVFLAYRNHCMLKEAGRFVGPLSRLACGETKRPSGLNTCYPIKTGEGSEAGVAREE